jgi:hypothetical protein
MACLPGIACGHPSSPIYKSTVGQSVKPCELRMLNASPIASVKPAACLGIDRKLSTARNEQLISAESSCDVFCFSATLG